MWYFVGLNRKCLVFTPDDSCKFFDSIASIKSIFVDNSLVFLQLFVFLDLFRGYILQPGAVTSKYDRRRDVIIRLIDMLESLRDVYITY